MNHPEHPEQSTRREERLRRAAAQTRSEHARRLRSRLIVAGAAVVTGLGGLFAVSTAGTSAPGSRTADDLAGQYAFAMGDPGPGTAAPRLRLASTAGGTWDLGARRGRTTLLYFQEGLGCQPCWDQITDIERQIPKLTAIGIDELVSITGNDLGQLDQKAGDEGIETPVLSDPELRQSRLWGANDFGMMGDSANGHSFVVVGPDGAVRARADYGGAPDYTMYVPVENLVADLRRQLALSSGA